MTLEKNRENIIFIIFKIFFFQIRFYNNRKIIKFILIEKHNGT